MRKSVQEVQLRLDVERYRAANDVIGALKALDQLIDLDVADQNDWCVTGQLLSEIGEFAQAVGAFERCIHIEPDHVAARHDLGRVLYNLGSMDRAATLIEQVAVETGREDLWMGLATIAPGVPSYSHHRIRQIREKYARIVRERENPTGQTSIAKSVQREGPIRIGYLSAHWNNANYMKPVWPLINAHDQERFELHLFDDAAVRNETWEWLRNSRSKQYWVSAMSNNELAESIRSLGIDILVDLSAYSKPKRLGLFVHRAAPVQMAWFNMYATSGFREIDFIIGDRYVMQNNEKRFYCERFLELPVSYLTFQTNHLAPDVSESPFYRRGHFAFGCLGTLYKITPQVIETWATILIEASDSRLILANRDLRSQYNRQYIADKFAERGVSTDRIVFLPPASHFEFLKHYNEIDLALDTFPYNGGTTTMEALWQGVPVLTFCGDRWASRTSRTILESADLGEFVSDSRQSYIRLAVQHATNSDRQKSMKELRRSMRDRLLRSSVCDSHSLARGMERIFSSIYSGFR